MADGGFILILTVLVLGGVIATLGDRIGTKVGKARLSLFNLRPKKTAVLVTVITGVMIAASTLGVLLLASSGFRDMLLKFDNIRSDLDRTQKDLNTAKTDIESRTQEKKTIESELGKARAQSRQVQKTLSKINASLKTAVDRQRETEGRRQAIERQAMSLKSEIDNLQQQQGVLAAQRDQVLAQIAQRDQEVQSRDREINQQEKVIRSRDQQIVTQERDINARNAAIAEREQRLKNLEQERILLVQKSAALGQDVESLRREANRLRLESASARTFLPSIIRNQVLSSRAFQVQDPKRSVEVISLLLQEANQRVFAELKPSTVPGNQRLIDVQSPDIEQELNRIIQKISDGKEYLVQIRAQENYFFGETTLVKISTIVVLNRRLFQPGDTLASMVVDPSKISSAELKEQFNQLIPRARLKAVSASWFPDPGKDGLEFNDVRSALKFFDQVRELTEPVEIRTIATEEVTPGTPIIHLDLVAIQQGRVIFQTERRR
jgi:uncharacterized protein (DUF3084 family)